MPDCNEDFKLQAPLAWLDSGAQNHRSESTENQMTESADYISTAHEQIFSEGRYQNADAHTVEDPTGGHHNAKLRFPRACLLVCVWRADVKSQTSERPRGCPRRKAGESNPKGPHM